MLVFGGVKGFFPGSNGSNKPLKDFNLQRSVRQFGLRLLRKKYLEDSEA